MQKVRLCLELRWFQARRAYGFVPRMQKWGANKTRGRESVIVRIDHEFKTLIPPLTPEERSGLEESLLEDGCRDALVVWGNTLIDGHNRYEICTKHGIVFQTVEKEFESRHDAKIWIILNQFGRRNLPTYERGKLALQLEGVFAAKAKENQLSRLKQYATVLENSPKREEQPRAERIGGSGWKPDPILKPMPIEPINTRVEVAKVAGVSDNTIQRIKKLEEKAPDAVKQKLRTGEMTINHAYTALKREEERAKREETPVQIPLPTGKYSVILADPPWRYPFTETNNRQIENHYPTMDLEEIKAMDLPADDNCVLFLWVTAPFLADAMHVLKAWGFTYKTGAVWDKERLGMGYWFRIQHEHLLIAVRGDVKTPYPENRVSSVIRAPRGEHSKKPECVYDMIEKMFPGERYLELFARTTRDGWSSWGNEVC